MAPKFRNPREVDTRESMDWWQADLMRKHVEAEKAAEKAGKKFTDKQFQQLAKEHWAEADREDAAKRAVKKAATSKAKTAPAPKKKAAAAKKPAAKPKKTK